MATNCNKGSVKNNSFIEKIFENIDNTQDQTEYQRTEVHGIRQGQTSDKNYGLNKTGDLRILNNSSDSMSYPGSYASQMKVRNAG